MSRNLVFPFLSDVLGLSLTITSDQFVTPHYSTPLSFAHEVESFDGLVVKYSRVASSDQGSKSMDIQIQRYALNDRDNLNSQLELTKDILGLHYKYQTTSDGWSTAVSCKYSEKTYDITSKYEQNTCIFIPELCSKIKIWIKICGNLTLQGVASRPPSRFNH